MRKKVRPDDYAFLSIKVSNYDVAVGEAVNSDLRSTVPLSCDDTDLVITPDFRITISGICTDPTERANDSYEITIYGDRLRDQTLKQIHARDKDNELQYRKYRGGSHPVFNAPQGLALLDRWRGERRWNTAIRVAPYAFNGIQTILGLSQQLYVSIHERKIARGYWIQGFTMQTTDPALG